MPCFSCAPSRTYNKTGPALIVGHRVPLHADGGRPVTYRKPFSLFRFDSGLCRFDSLRPFDTKAHGAVIPVSKWLLYTSFSCQLSSSHCGRLFFPFFLSIFLLSFFIFLSASVWSGDLDSLNDSRIFSHNSRPMCLFFFLVPVSLRLKSFDGRFVHPWNESVPFCSGKAVWM